MRTTLSTAARFIGALLVIVAANVARADDAPFVKSAYVCSALACDTLICPTDSIAVRITGSFPSDCYRLRRVVLWQPPIMTPRITPPWIVLLVDDGGCLGQVCQPGEYPFSATALLPPLPPGPYEATIAVAVASCTDSLPPGPWPTLQLPFHVSFDCPPPPPPACVFGSWLHRVYIVEDPRACDADLGPDGATVGFTVQSGVPLAGLQGEFTLGPPGLEIVKLEPIGPAAGMRLAWNKVDGGGARFVLFAEQGAPIPADGIPHPVVAVTAAPRPGVPVPDVTFVDARNLLGSDEHGGSVPWCPRRVADFARICAVRPRECDVNGDGLTDVRDLVLMVHCLYVADRCANSYDCNQDGSFTLDDVLCCAQRILRPQPCPPGGCPPDTTPVHTDDAVSLNVGIPVESGGDVRIPIRIDGAERLGAAKLVIPFPSDRYRLTGVDGVKSSWLPIVETDGGAAIVALIRIAPESATEQMNLTLSLQPVDGPPRGGEIGATQGEFTDPAGTHVLIRMDAPVRPLPGAAQMQLSENRPDPFSGETRFTVTAPVAGRLELGVYDLNGRRVASLHSGPIAAGTTEFSWAGRLDGGGRARSGVYFYRAVMASETVSRKMVLLEP